MGCSGSKATDPAPNAKPAEKKIDPKSASEAFNADKDAWKKVHSSVRWGKIADQHESEKIFSCHEAVNCIDATNGNQPIHIAAQNGHVDICRYLIAQKANVNATNAKGNTPLHMAIGYDYYECAQYLLDNGADPNIKNAAGVIAKRGLDNDKCLGLAALISVEKSLNPQIAILALDMCKEHLKEDVSMIDKASFAGAGLKAKKALADKWDSTMQDKFREIMMQL